uniref:Uncharacterized protein n=1 Tax=Cacopsylla melanoneura TaxID=428564 RepID=A0A8D9FI70_9HEMI
MSFSFKSPPLPFISSFLLRASFKVIFTEIGVPTGGNGTLIPILCVQESSHRFNAWNLNTYRYPVCILLYLTNTCSMFIVLMSTIIILLAERLIKYILYV